MKKSILDKFAGKKLDAQAMKRVVGGVKARCPESLSGGGPKCDKYWGDDALGAAACKDTCGY